VSVGVPKAGRFIPTVFALASAAVTGHGSNSDVPGLTPDVSVGVMEA
jgi:hypothetical protein